MGFSALIALTGLLFLLWHTWHYDGFKCLYNIRSDWFRTLMILILLVSIAFFCLATLVESYVLYDQYYVFLGTVTIPAPWQLYTPHSVKLWKASLWCLLVGWGFLQAVHMEEFLYWGYLMRSIRTPGGPRTSWLRSGFFKVWVAAFACSWALMIASLQIETHNLDMMRAYLFLIGSVISTVLALMSVLLCIVFPRFLTLVRQQGAGFEVLERLHFFKEANELRTVCRVCYALCFLILSTDATTPAQRINKSAFWADFLYTVGQLGLFASTCFSILILLPRNMGSESLPTAADNAQQPMVPYKLPHIGGGHIITEAQRGLWELGDRLNINRDALALTIPYLSSPGQEKDEGYELDESPRRLDIESSEPAARAEIQEDQAPFSEIADTRVRARYSEFPALPTVLQKFKSPFETAQASRRVSGPAQVFVQTTQTVHHEV
ncbi:hypothetical protein BCR39DRAFT_475657 [Naematelia encephala]|uniref:Uncharacterized protein n=1 Tax=Naematelia encephala TaxID=71784 RepID=A0A1Y2BLG2_9TREE|nr:hypothetical protein BCR39DRAFT_475657 [Naematelia encephala]